MTENQWSPSEIMGRDAPAKRAFAPSSSGGGFRSRPTRKPPCRGWLKERSTLGAGVGEGGGEGVGGGVGGAVGLGVAFTVRTMAIGDEPDGGGDSSLPPQARATAARKARSRESRMVAQCYRAAAARATAARVQSMPQGLGLVL